MIDGFDGRLIDTSIDGFGKSGDVEDVSGSATVGCDTGGVLLVEFVVQQEEGHVVGVDEPALVGVGAAGVGGA